MTFVNLTIKKEGLAKLRNWVKEKLTDEEQDKLAKMLDEIFSFEGVAGVFIETLDGMMFKKLIKEGVDSIFPDEPVNPS